MRMSGSSEHPPRSRWRQADRGGRRAAIRSGVAVANEREGKGVREGGWKDGGRRYEVN